MVPNLAHSAAPLLLLMLYCLALTNPNGIRYAAALILNFLLIFTGFGFFAGVLTVGVISIDLAHGVRIGHSRRTSVAALALVLSIASLLIFFAGHERNPAVDCLRFPNDDWIQYTPYISLMYSGYLGLNFTIYSASALIVGGVVLALMLVSFAVTSLRVACTSEFEPSALVPPFLIGFTLLYCLATAIGRTCLGVSGAQSSRYMTLMIPGFFGLYLTMLSRPPLDRRRVILTAGLVLLIVHGTAPWMFRQNGTAAAFATKKRAWTECYLREKDVKLCSTQIPLSVHPDDATVEEMLTQMRVHRLNFFAERVPSASR